MTAEQVKAYIEERIAYIVATRGHSTMAEQELTKVIGFIEEA